MEDEQLNDKLLCFMTFGSVLYIT